MRQGELHVPGGECIQVDLLGLISVPENGWGRHCGLGTLLNFELFK